MNYQVKSSTGEKAHRLSERFGLDMLTATILERRGLSSEEDMKYFMEKDLIYQHSPFLFEDSVLVVERLTAAIEDDERIMVFGDRDVDGITATTIMVKELERQGAKNLEWRLPMEDEPYGLTMDLVDEILEKEVKLLVTVDNGISAIDEIRALRNAGVDTIVLDHHLAGENLPPALAIMNPKVEDSGYPFNGLAGCMVAFKACYALRMSKTDIYSSEFILLHASLGNDSVRINAVRFENLVEVDRITEEVADGCYSLEDSRIIRFLSIGRPILVLDRDTELKLLKRAFGNSVDINLIEIRPVLEKVISSVRGRSLFDLSNISRAARYERGDSEIETLISLYRSASIYQYRNLYAGMDDLIQLATLGTIADLMPLREENRLFVRMGLISFERSPMYALRYLFSKLDLLGKPLTVRDISFAISPVINSSGRMGHPDIACRLLLSQDQGEIIRLTDKLLEMNRERQRNTEEALERCRPIAEASLEYYGGKLIMIEGDIPRGLTGAIASRFLNEFKVPSLVLAGMEDGRVSASMRTRKGFNARQFLDNFSHLFQDFGGHNCAAGFSMEADNLDRFRDEVLSVITEMKPSTAANDDEVIVDAELSQNMIGERLWKIKDQFEPFGQENEKLLFYVPHVYIADVATNRNGGTYLRCTLDINQQFWPAVWWDHDQEPGYYGKGDEVNIIFSPEYNTWKGVTKCQINIISMEKST